MADRREQFARPYAVTAHAVKRYRERLNPAASRDEAIAELQRALQTPAFERPARDGATLYGCRDSLGRRIGIVVAPPPRREEGEPGSPLWPIILTVNGWPGWQQYRSDFERMGADRPGDGGLVGGASADEPRPPEAALPGEAGPAASPRRCRACRQPLADASRASCPECRAKEAAAVRNRRRARRAAGLCPRCGSRRPEEGYSRCSECRAKQQALDARRRGDKAPGRGPTPYRQNQIDFVSRYSGLRTLEWIAGRLGVSPGTVANLLGQEGLGPTTRGDWLTASQAAEILGYTPQWVARLCRAGRLRARRNPTSRGRHHRWWLIERGEVQRWLGEEGRESGDPRLIAEPGWPRAIPRRRGGRR